MVDAQVRLTGGDEIQAYGSLAQRLYADDALHGRVRRVDRPIRESELGGSTELLSVALSSGVGMALFRALKVWIERQRSEVRITVTVGKRKVEVDATNLKEVEPTLREVLGLPATATGSEES